MICALNLCSLPEVGIAEAHADDFARVRVDYFEGVLAVADVPVAEGACGVCLAKVIVYGAGEENVEHEGAHGVVFEGGEVDIVDAWDVGYKCRENHLRHCEYSLQYAVMRLIQ